MSKTIYKNVTGYCPATNKENTIQIEYSEVSICGSMSENYKAVSLCCDHSEQCTEKNCPIVQENLTFEI